MKRTEREIVEGLAKQAISLRKKLGLTQSELAKRAGVSTRTISRIETADSIDILVHVWIKVARALGTKFEIELI